MPTIRYTFQFKKDLRKALKRGCKESKLKPIVDCLSGGQALPKKYKDHQLVNSRNYKNMRECHISPDWLLIYKPEEDLKIIRLIRTGSHSDLF